MATKKQFASLEAALAGAKTPVLVDFYATWCGPCKMMAGTLEQVGPQLRGRLQIIKIDSDRYPEISSRYGVQALPTLVLFTGVQEVQRLEGALPAAKLVEWLEPHL